MEIFLIAKHRNGELGEIPLKFIHAQTKITNHDFDQPQMPTIRVEPTEQKTQSQSMYEIGLRISSESDFCSEINEIPF